MRLTKRPIEVSIAVRGVTHPVFLRLRTTDVELCREVLLKGQYDCDFAKRPRVIVDAGANIGLASIFYANKYPDARIIAIEPEPSNYQMLVRNLAPYSKVETVHAALWKDNCAIQLRDKGTGHTGFQTSAESDDAAASVQGVTLDQLMRDFGIDYIDLLKVDIEGAEREVFEHSPNWLNSVGIVAVELHDWLRDGCGQSVRSATRNLNVEWQSGEITYFTTSAYAPAASERQRLPVSVNNGPAPLKILRTC